MDILIIDSDKSFVKGLQYSLEQEKYNIFTESLGKNALDKLRKKSMDLILMDIVVEDMDGLVLCEKIREITDVPIIVLSEEKDVLKKVLFFEYGGDDYIIKPFNILELKARVKALLSRTRLADGSDQDNLSIGNFTINALGRKVIVGNREIELTGKEFDLFYVLATNPGRVFQREELLEIVWGYAYYGDLRTVDVHIRKIREKIEKDSSEAKHILTKWGIGYYFRE